MQVLVAATGKSVKLEECGIPLNRRFAFYDQIHTTGMDIKHIPNACALLTLGKDMVFRDLAQGAYRMRGIGKGQTLDFLVIPEILSLVQKHANFLQAKSIRSQNVTAPHTEQLLVDVLVWLLGNSMKSERTQYTQLSWQNASNIFRKESFNMLMEGSALPCQMLQDPRFHQSLKLFKEEVSFDISDQIPKSVSIVEKIEMLQKEFFEFIRNKTDCLKELQKIKNDLLSASESSDLDSEKELEQEVEQEQVFPFVFLSSFQLFSIFNVI